VMPLRICKRFRPRVAVAQDPLFHYVIMPQHVTIYQSI